MIGGDTMSRLLLKKTSETIPKEDFEHLDHNAKLNISTNQYAGKIEFKDQFARLEEANDLSLEKFIPAAQSIARFSCFIIAKNEARKIGDVIKAVRDLADEVVVIDSSSTDGTQQIAEDLGARVIFNEWPGYGSQKRFGEEQCRNDWVLNLDGDEVLSEELRAEIRALFANGRPSLSLYQINIVAVPPFGNGRPWHLNAVKRIRLYDRRVVRFPDHPTWDAIAFPKDGEFGVLKGIVKHYWMKDFEQQVAKMNAYTTALAEAVPPKSMSSLTLRLFFGFPFDFFRAFILRGHIVGGRYGFAVAMLYAFSRMMRTVKMMERRWRVNA